MSALQLLLCASLAPSYAQGPSPLHADEDWIALDRELEGLASIPRAAPASAGATVGGWIRTRYANSGDVDADPSTAAQEDLGGFNLDNARLVITGSPIEGWGFTLSLEGGDDLVADSSSSDVGVVDAYASVRFNDWVSASIGRFSSTVLWNTCVEERCLLFLDRSFLDEFWDGRDIGVELSGAVQRFNWWAAAQNGTDGAGDDCALSARASFHVLGDGLIAQECCQALPSGEEHLTVGVCWFDDTELDEGSAVGADVLFLKDRWSVVAEIVDFGDDLQPGLMLIPSTGALIPSGLTATGADTPLSLTVGYLLVPDEWELGVRVQDLDDDADTFALGAAVNRYLAGHNAKWTAQVDSADSDDPALDAVTFAVGLTVGV